METMNKNQMIKGAARYLGITQNWRKVMTNLETKRREMMIIHLRRRPKSLSRIARVEAMKSATRRARVELTRGAGTMPRVS